MSDPAEHRYYTSEPGEHPYRSAANEFEFHRPGPEISWTFPFADYPDLFTRMDAWEGEEFLSRLAAEAAARRWIKNRCTDDLPVDEKAAFFLRQRFQAARSFLNDLVLDDDTSPFVFAGSYEELLELLLMEWWRSVGSMRSFQAAHERFLRPGGE